MGLASLTDCFLPQPQASCELPFPITGISDYAQDIRVSVPYAGEAAGSYGLPCPDRITKWELG